MTGIKIREFIAVALMVIALIAVIAAKILWAITAWYEWIPLGIAFACLGLIKLLQPSPSNPATTRSHDHAPDHRSPER